MTKRKDAVCSWCAGTGWIVISKRGQIVRKEICNKCKGTGNA